MLKLGYQYKTWPKDNNSLSYLIPGKKDEDALIYNSMRIGLQNHDELKYYMYYHL